MIEAKKIVSLTCTGVEANQFTQCEALVFALCDDGDVWVADNRGWKWERMPRIEPSVAQRCADSAASLAQIASDIVRWESDPDKYAGDLADIAQHARGILAYINNSR